MYEELLYPEEQGRRSEKYPKIFVGCPLELDVDRLAAAVLNLEQVAEKGDTEDIYNIFATLPMGYTGPKTTFSPGRSCPRMKPNNKINICAPALGFENRAHVPEEAIS